jgi:hypothetical protein
VALHYRYVQRLLDLQALLRIAVDEDEVVFLTRELLGQIEADLTGPYDNDLHISAADIVIRKKAWGQAISEDPNPPQ